MLEELPHGRRRGIRVPPELDRNLGRRFVAVGQAYRHRSSSLGYRLLTICWESKSLGCGFGAFAEEEMSTHEPGLFDPILFPFSVLIL